MSQKSSPSLAKNRISSLVSLYESQTIRKSNPVAKNNAQHANYSSTTSSHRSSALPDPPVFKFCSPSLTTSGPSNATRALPGSKPLQSLSASRGVDAPHIPSPEVLSSTSTGTFRNVPRATSGICGGRRSSKASRISSLDSMSTHKSYLFGPSTSPMIPKKQEQKTPESTSKKDYKELAFPDLSPASGSHSHHSPVSVELLPSEGASAGQRERVGERPNDWKHYANSNSLQSSPLLSITQSSSRSSHERSESTEDRDLGTSVFLYHPVESKALPPEPQSSGMTDVPSDTLPLLMRGNSTVSCETSTTADIPAHRVFSRGAPALFLPALDEMLENIEDADFQEVKHEEMSEQEWQTWREWTRGTNKSSTASRWNPFNFMLRRKRNKPHQPRGDQFDSSFAKKERVNGEDKSINLEANSYPSLDGFEESPTIPILPNLPTGIPASRAKAPCEEGIRRLIFLPMHLLPPNLTITDLKLNKSASAPLLTLNEILSVGIDALLGVEGSSYALSLMNIEMFRDMLQMIGLLIGFGSPSSQSPLHTSSAVLYSSSSSSSTISGILYGKIPAIIGLDLVSAFGKAVLWFWFFSGICSICLYEFYRLTGGWEGPKAQATTRTRVREGFDMEDNFHGLTSRWKWRQSKAYITTITFLIASLYVPLSKISMGALVWTSDFWEVPNPYVDSDQPQVEPLEPSDVYRDPLDFCYTTTMMRYHGGLDNINWTALIILASALKICVLSLWFPIRLWKTVNVSAPKVDKYTELGQKRKAVDQEYERLVDRDKGPFVFFYNCYRRRWSGFKAFFMAVKLVTVAIHTIVIKDNCLFRNYLRDRVDTFREGISIGIFTIFLVIQIATQPFIHPLQNASDSVSRSGYLLISFIGLLVSFKVKGSSTLGGPILILVTVLIYVLNAYFSLIRTGLIQRVIKRMQKRLDFSIDLFSPRLDLSKHISRRVWQETICTLLLALPEYKMPSKDSLKWKEEGTGPPYLLRFRGTQAERLIENLKIMRAVGLEEYTRASNNISNPDRSNKDDEVIQALILHEFTGPDCFWKPPSPPYAENVTTFFGRAEVVPFPFTVIFRYDQSPHPICITDSKDLRAYATQNNTMEVLMRRQVRLLFRCLEGKEVFSPVTESWDHVKRKHPWIKWLSLSPNRSHVHFRSGILKIRRNCQLCWHGYNYNSGFEVVIDYCDGQSTDSNGSITSRIKYTRKAHSIGILDDFRVSPGIAKIFQDNRHIINSTIGTIQTRLKTRRDFFATQVAWKRNTMSYSFLLKFLLREEDITFAFLEQRIKQEEVDPKMRAFPEMCRGSLSAVEERLRFVHRNKLTRWWYTFFDDVYRRNAADLPALSSLPADFSPHYRTSICYRPMSRARLESFLIERQLATVDGRGGFFHSGLLNRIYFYLDEIMFEGTSKGIPIHLGISGGTVKLDHLSSLNNQYDGHALHSSGPQSYYDPYTHSQYTSRFTQNTGEGTDEGDPVIRFRDAFTHEQIFDETSQQTPTRIGYTMKNFTRGMREWLGLVPIHHSSSNSAGIFLGLRQTATGFELPKSRSSPEMGLPDDTSSTVHLASERNTEMLYSQIDTLLYGTHRSEVEQISRRDEQYEPKHDASPGPIHE